MVSYTVIKQSNARIRSTLPPSPTALFVGATSGIGRECMRAFVSYIQSPILYVVARSKSTGDREIEGLKELNDKGTYHFVEGDFTLLSSVEKVAQTVIEAMKEKGLDYVSLSPGFLDFSGRKETREGLDALLTIRYHARARLLHLLLSSLPTDKRPKHILLVLAAGTEGKIIEEDMLLKDTNNYGIINVNNHSSSFSSLAIEHLAEEYPSTSFVHIYPGLVKTQQLSNWIKTPIYKWLMDWVVIPLITPFTVSLQEVGDRCLFYLTSKRFPSKEGREDFAKADGVDMPEGVKAANGDGAYLVGKDSEDAGGKTMEMFRKHGTGEMVWQHSLDVFEEVRKKGV